AEAIATDPQLEKLPTGRGIRCSDVELVRAGGKSNVAGDLVIGACRAAEAAGLCAGAAVYPIHVELAGVMPRRIRPGKCTGHPQGWEDGEDLVRTTAELGNVVVGLCRPTG